MTQPTHTPDRRLHPRARVGFHADVWLDRGDETTHIDGRLAVVGAGGALLELGENYAVGSVLTLRFTIAELGEITCRAIVRRSLEGKGVAVEFLDLEPYDQELIKALVEKTMSNT